MSHKLTALTLLAGFCLSGAAQAALHDRGGGLIYDDVLNITWLRDANYAQTSNYHLNGLMNWGAAMDWAANLTYAGHSDWRLPTAFNADGTGPCEGYGCTGSEMGHLFYITGGLSAGQRISGSLTLTQYFVNMQDHWVYWSGTEAGQHNAWVFHTLHGHQNAPVKWFGGYAWPVHPGDIAPIPEPESYALLLAGLGLVGMAARRRRGRSAAIMG